MAEPTSYDYMAAASRRRIANNALALLHRATNACGPNATAYGFWSIIDRMGKKRRRLIFCCRRSGTHIGWKPEPPANNERDPSRRYEFANGRVDFAFRFTIQFSMIHEYHPKTPQQLADLRESREKSALKKERLRLPLFADQITARHQT